MSSSDQSLVLNLLKLPENALCADCQQNKPKWASCNLGVFICLECSGIHRSLGSHISFVRSCNLDSWSHDQAMRMKCIGNQKANQYWEYNLPSDFIRPNSRSRHEMEAFIRDKYVNKRWVRRGIKGPHELPLNELNSRSNEEILGYAAKEEKTHPDFSMDDLLNEIDIQKVPESKPQNVVEHVKYESVSFVPEESENNNTSSKNRLTSVITTSASIIASSAKGIASSATSTLQDFFKTIERNEQEDTKNNQQIKKEEKYENNNENVEKQNSESKISFIKGTAMNIYNKVASYFYHENNINEDKQTLHMEEEEKHFETKEEKLKNALSQLQTTDMSALEDFFQEQNYNLDKEYEIQNNNETTSSKNNNCKEEEEESCLLEIAPFEEDKKEQINKNKDNGKELLIENSKQNKEEEDLSFDFLKSDKNNEEDISFDFLPKTDSNFEFKSNKQEKPCVETSNLEKFFESHEELCTHTYETKKLSKPQESLQTTQKIKEPNNFDEFQFLQEEPTQKTTKNEKTKKPEQQDKNQQKYTNNQTNQQMLDSFGFLVLDESRQIP